MVTLFYRVVCGFLIVSFFTYTMNHYFTKVNHHFQGKSRILELKVRRFILRADWLMHSGASLGNIQSLSLFARYPYKSGVLLQDGVSQALQEQEAGEISRVE